MTRDPHTIPLDDIPALLELAFNEGAACEAGPFSTHTALFPRYYPDRTAYHLSATNIVAERIRQRKTV